MFNRLMSQRLSGTEPLFDVTIRKGVVQNDETFWALTNHLGGLQPHTAFGVLRAR